MVHLVRCALRSRFRHRAQRSAKAAHELLRSGRAIAGEVLHIVIGDYRRDMVENPHTAIDEWRDLRIGGVWRDEVFEPAVGVARREIAKCGLPRSGKSGHSMRFALFHRLDERMPHMCAQL